MKKAIITINLFCSFLVANNFEKLHQNFEQLHQTNATNNASTGK